MPIDTSPALVLKSVDFSETSLILTLFTRNYGKVHGIAKGGRRLKNPFDSALDLLAQISVSFIRKNSDSLDILTEAKLVNRFRPTPGNMSGFYAAFCLVDLLNAMTGDGEPNPKLFDLACETLDRFESGDSPGLTLVRFEWKLLSLTGQEPATRFCVECGKPVPVAELLRRDDRVSFATLDGGTVCTRCRNAGEYRQTASVSSAALRLLQCFGEDGPFRIVGDPVAEAGTRPSALVCDGGRKYIRLADGTEFFALSILKETRGLMSYYITQILGYRPMMYDYLNLV